MGMRIVPRYQRITLGEEYADVWMDVRVNPPMAVYDEFGSKDLDRAIKALASLTQASNLEAEDGAPIDLTVIAGWSLVPKDFLEEALDKLVEAIKAPKQTTPSSSGSSSTGETSPTSSAS